MEANLIEEILAKNPFSHEVKINLDMLCTSMENRVWSNSKGKDAIAPKNGGFRQENPQGLWEESEANKAQWKPQQEPATWIQLKSVKQ